MPCCGTQLLPGPLSCLPADRNAFSLHNLCVHGRTAGVVPGRWLGPWVVCKALEATARAALQVGRFRWCLSSLARPGGPTGARRVL